MSHICNIKDFVITDLNILKKVVDKLGLELTNNTKCRYYNNKTEDVYKTIEIPDCKWNIGLKQVENGYILCGDFYSTTGKIVKDNINKIKREYASELITKIAKKKKYKIKKEIKGGKIHITCYL